jgi:NAD+ kinase
MKNVKIVSRKDFDSENLRKYFEEVLVKNGYTLSDEPELVLSIGGDQTMLQSFRTYGSDKHYVGLNTGTLGFYTDFKKEEADELLEYILSEKPFETVSYPLVELEFQLTNGEVETELALNEAVIKSKSLATFVMEVYVNEKRFETFRGDGLIISTPSGSTAYNHSVQGAIIHPSLVSMQISELAAINNREYRTLNRPMVLPGHHTLDLYIKNATDNVLVGIDGFDCTFSSIRKIRATVSQEKIKFARYRSLPFWGRVKEKFLD